MDPQYEALHVQHAYEYRNSTHWPKHLLIHYSWKHVPQVHGELGLMVLFVVCFAVGSVSMLLGVGDYFGKLGEFVETVLADEAAAKQSKSGPSSSGKAE
jgi:hypothetical protein